MNNADLTNAFKLMGQGMAGVFAVMCLIALTVYVFTRVSNGKKCKNSDKKETL